MMAEEKRLSLEKEEKAEIAEARKAYYTAKAVYDAAAAIIADRGAAEREAKAKVEEALHTVSLAEEEKKEITEKINGLLEPEVKEGEDAKEVAASALSRLQTYEQDAEFAVTVSGKRMDKKKDERSLKKYYTAKAKFDFIEGTLGDKSPAKKAKKALKAQAEEQRALEDIATALQEAKNTQDIATALSLATKGSSKVADIL